MTEEKSEEKLLSSPEMVLTKNNIKSEKNQSITLELSREIGKLFQKLFFSRALVLDLLDPTGFGLMDTNPQHFPLLIRIHNALASLTRF